MLAYLVMFTPFFVGCAAWAVGHEYSKAIERRRV